MLWYWCVHEEGIQTQTTTYRSHMLHPAWPTTAVHSVTVQRYLVQYLTAIFPPRTPVVRRNSSESWTRTALQYGGHVQVRNAHVYCCNMIWSTTIRWCIVVCIGTAVDVCILHTKYFVQYIWARTLYLSSEYGVVRQHRGDSSHFGHKLGVIAISRFPRYQRLAATTSTKL